MGNTNFFNLLLELIGYLDPSNIYDMNSLGELFRRILKALGEEVVDYKCNISFELNITDGNPDETFKKEFLISLIIKVIEKIPAGEIWTQLIDAIKYSDIDLREYPAIIEELCSRDWLSGERELEDLN